MSAFDIFYPIEGEPIILAYSAEANRRAKGLRPVVLDIDRKNGREQRRYAERILRRAKAKSKK